MSIWLWPSEGLDFPTAARYWQAEISAQFTCMLARLTEISQWSYPPGRGFQRHLVGAKVLCPVPFIIVRLINPPNYQCPWSDRDPVKDFHLRHLVGARVFCRVPFINFRLINPIQNNWIFNVRCQIQDLEKDFNGVSSVCANMTALFLSSVSARPTVARRETASPTDVRSDKRLAVPTYLEYLFLSLPPSLSRLPRSEELRTQKLKSHPV